MKTLLLLGCLYCAPSRFVNFDDFQNLGHEDPQNSHNLAARTIALLSSRLSAEDPLPSFSMVDCFKVPLDHKLAELLNLTGGVFIEVGANDGVTQSNTKLLEDFYGWTGILVEPSANIFDLLETNRPRSICFNCALGSFEEDHSYINGDFDGSLMSSVNGKRRREAPNKRVPIRSLQSILNETGLTHIDFFSLDTEGYELNILNGIDFDKTTFGYLLIEIYTWDYAAIVSFLAERGYELVCNFTNYNPATNPGWDKTHNDYLFKKIGS